MAAGNAMAKADTVVSVSAPFIADTTTVVNKMATLNGRITARVSCFFHGRIDNQMAGKAPDSPARPPKKPPASATLISVLGVSRSNFGKFLRNPKYAP